MEFQKLLGLLETSSWRTLIAAVIVVIAGLIVHRVGAAIIWRISRNHPVSSAVARRCWRPARLVLPVLGLQAVWQAASDTLPFISAIRHGNALLLLAGLTWLMQRAVSGVAQGIVAQHPVNVEDNLNARRVLTQTRLLARTVSFMVVVAGLSMMLMTFPGARQLGASLLASAGVIGIVAGIAARPVFSNLIAGLQLALAQPMRIDDVLIVKGEWGRVEEITGTYVVLKIWDERRLIIPLQWFIENPFENWTRNSANIIGTVFLWVDYRMPLAPLREAALRTCETAPEWDKRLCLLQVTEAGERSMQLRLLLTSATSSLNWDLRCKVREALVDFMQRNYPQFLPVTRAELAGPATPESSPPTPSSPPSPVSTPGV